MAEEVIFEGKKYKRVNGKWVDKNYMVVTCVLRRPAAADADLNGRDAAWRPA